MHTFFVPHSENFIAAAKRIKSGDNYTFQLPIEGDIAEEVSVALEPGISAKLMQNVNFFQGDAGALSDYADDSGFGTFDGVIMSNLLCRLPDPVAALNALPKIVNQGGVVIIVTPYTWLEGMSPDILKNFWI